MNMMHTMKKLLIVCTVICLAALIGCSKEENGGNNPQGSNGGETPAKSNVTIEMMHFWSTADATIKEIAKAFKEETGITVNVVNSQVANHLTTLNQRAQSDDVPEIFTMWPGPSVEPYIDSQVVADLSDVEWADSLKDFVVEAGTHNGKLYVAPVNTAFLTLAYNAEVFERLGLSEPANYAEFEQILEALKADSEVQVPFINGADFLLNISSAMFASDIYQTYPDFDQQVTDGKMAFNGPEVEALYKKLLIDWPAKGYINAETALSTDRMGRAVLDFLDGKAGIMQLGSWDLAVLDEVNTKGTTVKMLPYPAVDNTGSLIAAAGEAFALSGFAEGEERDAALQFLAYLMKPDNNAKICQAIASLSALKDVEVDVNPTVKNLERFTDQPAHGWLVWPLDVQNNLKDLGDVLTAKPENKEKVLKDKLAVLQAAWK
jgi:raffinose/stachyose/melibiose transport system substrate-binding protein